MSGLKFYPSQRQQREWKHSPRDAHDLIALPWAGKEANGELVLPSAQSSLFSQGAGVGVGDNGTSSTPPIPGSRQLPSGISRSERRTQTLDRQTVILFVPGLGYHFGENFQGAHSVTSQHFPETALALAGGCPGPWGQQGEVGKTGEGQSVCSVG